MPKPYNLKLRDKARELRNNATKYENDLWYNFLRTYKPKFLRQKPIGGFIADFYCYEAELIVELDGSQHYEEQGKAYDAERTAILERYGIKVIRFSNLDIVRNFEGVCEAIDMAVKARIQ